MSGALGKVRDKWREVGLLRLINVMGHNLLPRRLFDYSIQVVVGRDLAEAGGTPAAVPGLRQAGPDDSALLTAFGTSREAIAGRFASGCRAWVIERDGRLIASDWLNPGAEKMIWEWLCLTGHPGDVWHEIVEVARDSRGQGLGPKIRGQVAADCAREGVRRLLGNVDIDNRRSLKALAKAGYRPLARFFYLRCGRLTLVIHRGRPRIGLWSARRLCRLVVPEVSRRCRP